MGLQNDVTDPGEATERVSREVAERTQRNQNPTDPGQLVEHVDRIMGEKAEDQNNMEMLAQIDQMIGSTYENSGVPANLNDEEHPEVGFPVRGTGADEGIPENAKEKYRDQREAEQQRDDPRVTQMEEQIKFLTGLVEKAINRDPNLIQQQQEEPEEEFQPPENYLEGEDPEDLIDNPDKFNQLLKRVVDNETRRERLELNKKIERLAKMVESMPTYMEQRQTQQETVKRTADAFFKKNSDLDFRFSEDPTDQYRANFLSTVAAQLAEKHKDWDMARVLDEAGNTVRSVLNLPKQVEQPSDKVVQMSRGSRHVPGKSSARKPAGPTKPAGNAVEGLDELIHYAMT